MLSQHRWHKFDMEMEAVQWLERAWRFAKIVAAYRAGPSPLGTYFQGYNVSQLSTLRHCFDVCVLGHMLRCLRPWARHFTPASFTWLRCKWVPDRTDMCTKVQCAEHAAGLYILRAVEMAHEQVQWPRDKLQSRMISLQTWYQTIQLHIYLYLTFEWKRVKPK